MTAETAVTHGKVSYSGIAGLVIGLVLSIFYGLMTIGPIYMDSDYVPAGCWALHYLDWFGAI